MLAVLCPGQGAQSPGFLTPWLDDESARLLLDRLSASAGFDLVAAGSEPDRDVVDTAVAQPLIVAAGLVAAAALGPLPAGTTCAGHSIGEFTAATVAGAVGDSDAVRLSAVRGRAMAEASAQHRGAMVAVLGGDPQDVTAAAERAGAVVANHNGAGQLVVAGPVEAVEAFLADPPAGARLRRLSVAGAFHTPLMASATAELASSAADVAFSRPRSAWLSNADGDRVDDPAGIRDRLVAQVTRPVRWDRCLEELSARGVTACIELAPAGTLTGIVKRAVPGVRTAVVNGPEDVPAARALLADYLDSVTEAADLSVLISPASGTWRPARNAAGSDSWVEVGAVVNRTEPVPVMTRRSTPVVEWLAADGDPVREGQPLARLTTVQA